MAHEITSTRLRLPKGLHRLITQVAKRNNRSFNSEVLWRVALSLAAEGEETAPKLVEEMAVEQRRALDLLVKVIEEKRLKPAQPTRTR